MVNMKEKTERTIITCALPREVYKMVDRAAKSQYTSRSAVLRKIICEYVLQGYLSDEAAEISQEVAR